MTPRDIDAERLALLLEGKLSPDERAKLVEELAESPELREAFADAAAVIGEIPPDLRSDTAPAATPITSAPSRRRRFVEFAIAAGVVLALLVPLTRFARRSTDLPEPAAVVAMLSANANPQLEAKPWRELRGAGQALSPNARAVRIGALIADLEVASSRRDTSAARFAARVAALADEYPGGSAAGDSYRAITGGSSSSARAEARNSMETLVGRRELRLGAWLETARAAALVRDSSFFASSATNDALRIAASVATGNSTALNAVNRLSAVLARPARDWSAIASGTDLVLGALADAP